MAGERRYCVGTVVAGCGDGDWFAGLLDAPILLVGAEGLSAGDRVGHRS